ncbi:MAG TPA: spermidine/putrescine ABC transporter substrate-binding protein [Thermoleophilaceae bacterium]|nr:spermidine/putrescine ABC transporter substrate-binding protein [Thermoleophilaceae bacterium]
MVTGPMTRRALVRRGAALALAPALLASCGDDDALVFSSWPEYIDQRAGHFPTLERFEREYGTAVTFSPEISDYATYFAKLRPQLAQGRSGGRDLIVTVDWLSARMHRLGYVERLDAFELPNVRRQLIPRLRHPDFDPERHWSVPWQVGQTGLLYDREVVGGEIESVEQLFDPRFRGRVLMQTEMRDSVGLVMLASGDDPETAGLDKALAAVERIERAARDGQVRAFTGFEYRVDLVRGDAAIAIGWSGDGYRIGRAYPRIRFVHPAEGYMLWTDNLQIPVGAPHRAGARRLINFYYRPEIHFRLTRQLFYVPPVRGVRKLAAELQPELLESPLVFPDDRTLERGRIFRTLRQDEERQLDAAFQRAIGA